MQRIGWADNNGMGPVALRYSEAESYARLNYLSAAEANLIRELSAAYLSGLRKGRDIFAIPPWSPDG